MIIDNDPIITRNISVPRDMSQLSCSSFTAGIVEAVLDGLGFVRHSFISFILARSLTDGIRYSSLLVSRHTIHRMIYIPLGLPFSSSSRRASWRGRSSSSDVYHLLYCRTDGCILCIFMLCST